MNGMNELRVSCKIETKDKLDHFKWLLINYKCSTLCDNKVLSITEASLVKETFRYICTEWYGSQTKFIIVAVLTTMAYWKCGSIAAAQ